MSSKRNNLTARLNRLRRKRDAKLEAEAEKREAKAEKRRKAQALAVQIANPGRKTL